MILSEYEPLEQKKRCQANYAFLRDKRVSQRDVVFFLSYVEWSYGN